VLLLGTVGAGKSTLFYWLRDGEFRETHTSQKENAESFTPAALKNQQPSVPPRRFVDFPGHGSFKLQLPAYYPSASGIVFVVDQTLPDATALSLDPNARSTRLRTVSQQLFALLTNPTLVRRRVPILVACNTKNAKTAKSVKTESVASIQSALEALLTKSIRLQETVADIGTGEDHQATELRLGRDDGDFKFSDATSPVTFVSYSVDESAKDVVNFIRKL
jgi:signal recognition particle receptor subunit beta